VVWEEFGEYIRDMEKKRFYLVSGIAIQHKVGSQDLAAVGCCFSASSPEEAVGLALKGVAEKLPNATVARPEAWDISELALDFARQQALTPLPTMKHQQER
jgi:hypothetical protein